jgi:2-iminobutanoate/2-iminopropanoate deaminase
MSFQTIVSNQSAPPLAPYSPALRVGPFLFISGQIPIQSDGQMVTGDFDAETRQVCQNVTVLLEAAGIGWSSVCKVTIFTTDLSKFEQINAIYSEFVQAPFPARAAIEVAALPKGARIEMEVMAYVK